MAITLKHLRTEDADRRPESDQIAEGQIAINTASGTPGLFFKDENETIVKVGPVHVGSGAPNSTATTSGNSLGELWFDSSALKIWDGSVWQIASGAFINNGALSIASSGVGITGSGTFTANQAGNTSVTISSNATSANTASTIVARDASGNFSAGTITATSFSGNLANTLTLNTSGSGLSGSATFNNSGASTFTVTSNATSANTVSTIVARDASGNFSAGTVTASGFVSADATSTSLTTGAIKLNGATGAIILDDNGHKRLSWNDGAGNLNLRAGNYFNGTSLVFAKGTTDSNGGAASITLSNDGQDGSISLNAAAIGTPGNAVTFTNTFQVNPTFTASNSDIVTTKTNTNQTYAGQHLVDAPFTNYFSQSGSQYQAIVKGKATGAANTIFASFGVLHNNDNSHNIVFHRIKSDGTDSRAYALTGNGGTIWHSGNHGAGSTLDADLLDGIDSSGFFRANDFANTGNIRINNASPTIGLIDTDHATASIHVNSNIFYVLRNAANTAGWAQVDGIWPLEINLLNNDAQFGRTITSQSYQNIVKFSAPWRNNGVTALASSYNYIMTAGNDTGNKLSMFVNSSTRTADGGASGLTFRNDGGVLNLGQTGTQTSIFGSQINLSGGSTYYLKNNPAISNVSYGAPNNHIELTTTDGSNPIIGFHRSGFTAVALYHDADNSLRLRANTGNDSLIWHSTNDGAGSGLDADILSGTIRISAFDFSSATTTQRISAQSGNLYICNGNGGNGDNPLSIQRANSTGNAIRFINASTQVGTVVINAASTSYNTTSDYRLKENVAPLTGALSRLQLIPVHRFNFTAAPDKTVDGFLAHEVQDIVPEAITGMKDAVEAIGTITDADGNVIQENVTQPSILEEGQEWEQTGEQPSYQGIDQSKLVPLLTAAVQELLARVEALESA